MWWMSKGLEVMSMSMLVNQGPFHMNVPPLSINNSVTYSWSRWTFKRTPGIIPRIGQSVGITVLCFCDLYIHIKNNMGMKNRDRMTKVSKKPMGKTCERGRDVYILYIERD
ncbi:hypothetical protein HanRHA438_Chr12g0549951 [Helianthus annuus]|nr:hypothetical protein HanRHA438_Chr12g0549951 [Helianthus annuus]